MPVACYALPDEIKAPMDFMTSEIDPGLMKHWLHCARDCYKCGRCKAEFERITGEKEREKNA